MGAITKSVNNRVTEECLLLSYKAVCRVVLIPKLQFTHFVHAFFRLKYQNFQSKIISSWIYHWQVLESWRHLPAELIFRLFQSKGYTSPWLFRRHSLRYLSDMLSQTVKKNMYSEAAAELKTKGMAKGVLFSESACFCSIKKDMSCSGHKGDFCRKCLPSYILF